MQFYREKTTFLQKMFSLILAVQTSEGNELDDDGSVIGWSVGTDA